MGAALRPHTGSRLLGNRGALGQNSAVRNLAAAVVISRRTGERGVQTVLPGVESAVLTGAIVTVQDARVRVRELPIE